MLDPMFWSLLWLALGAARDSRRVWIVSMIEIAVEGVALGAEADPADTGADNDYGDMDKERWPRRKEIVRDGG